MIIIGSSFVSAHMQVNIASQVYGAKLQKTMEKEDYVEQTMKVAVKTLKGC